MIIHNSVELREREAKIVSDFAEWRSNNGVILPVYFRKNHEDLRFYLAHNHDFEEAYAGMLAYEELFDSYLIHLFGKLSLYE